MKNKILYILSFSVQMMWAKSPTFPRAETEIYKIIKNPITQTDSLIFVGTTRAEITNALGNPDVSRNDDEDGDVLNYDDRLLLVSFLDDYPKGFYECLHIYANEYIPHNPYILSKKFMLGIGRTLSRELLDNYEYKVYQTKLHPRRINAKEEAALPKEAWRQYDWNILGPSGKVSGYFFTIEVENEKITQISIGYHSL
jgi:hypothetical protein